MTTNNMISDNNTFVQMPVPFATEMLPDNIQEVLKYVIEKDIKVINYAWRLNPLSFYSSPDNLTNETLWKRGVNGITLGKDLKSFFIMGLEPINKSIDTQFFILDGNDHDTLISLDGEINDYRDYDNNIGVYVLENGEKIITFQSNSDPNIVTDYISKLYARG